MSAWLPGADEIRIFSRDEKKQYDMAQRYRENRNVRFFLGTSGTRDLSTPPCMGSISFFTLLL